MNTVRTFIAIQLPADILRLMKTAQAQLQAAAQPGSARWVRVDGIHLTLKFLGPVPTSQVGAITQVMVSAARNIPPFSLTIGGAGCFPNLKRPRVVWIGVTEPTGGLNSLQRSLESALTPLGYPPEGKGFQPHLTLARAARDASPNDLRQLGEVVGAANIGTLGQFTVDQIALIESDLKPSGAEYTPLEHARLKS